MSVSRAWTASLTRAESLRASTSASSGCPVATAAAGMVLSTDQKKPASKRRPARLTARSCSSFDDKLSSSLRFTTPAVYP